MTATNRSFPVFIVYSRDSLGNIRDILSEVDSSPIGPMRVVYEGDRETNRTIVVIREQHFSKLEALGFTEKRTDRDFYIKRYVTKKSEFPNPNYRYVWHIPLPFKENDANKIKAEINERLERLVNFNIIPDNSWEVVIPLESRETGKLKDSCFVIWKEVGESVVLSRAILQDTLWNDGVNRINISWSKERIPKKVKESMSPLTILTPIRKDIKTA